jgi:hypothetical protein
MKNKKLIGIMALGATFISAGMGGDITESNPGEYRQVLTLLAA